MNACVIRQIFLFSFLSFCVYFGSFFLWRTTLNVSSNTHTHTHTHLILHHKPSSIHNHTTQMHSTDPTKASLLSLLNVPAILALLLACFSHQWPPLHTHTHTHALCACGCSSSHNCIIKTLILLLLITHTYTHTYTNRDYVEPHPSINQTAA